MALTSLAVVEIRSTGAADNGAIYNSTIAGAGTDYSQQDAAQLSITDADCNNSTTVTSVTGGFTAAMVGNGVHIAGAGYTTGFYEIRTYTNTNTIVIDRNPTGGGHPTAGALKVGGACTTIDAPLITNLSACTNAVIHIKAGNYTFAACTLPVANNASLNTIIGYNTTRNDRPVGANRPVITMSGRLTFTANNSIRDVAITGNFNDHMTVMLTDCRMTNCKLTQIVSTATNSAVAGGGSVRHGLVGCEVSCSGGQAINTIAFIDDCYVHDSVTGYSVVSSQVAVQINSTIIDTCSADGVRVSGSSRTNLNNCVIYNCADGVHTDTGPLSITNSILKGCTVGVRADASYYYIDRNNVFDNTTNFSAYAADGSSVLADPLLTDPANGDFTLRAGSPALNAALQNGTNTGAVGAYKVNIGVDQDSGVVGQVAYVG